MTNLTFINLFSQDLNNKLKTVKVFWDDSSLQECGDQKILVDTTKLVGNSIYSKTITKGWMGWKAIRTTATARLQGNQRLNVPSTATSSHHVDMYVPVKPDWWNVPSEDDEESVIWLVDGRWTVPTRVGWIQRGNLADLGRSYVLGANRLFVGG